MYVLKLSVTNDLNFSEFPCIFQNFYEFFTISMNSSEFSEILSVDQTLLCTSFNDRS